jgi:aryl-alcohol dehydrogenase-like predicted oxidoreductase
VNLSVAERAAEQRLLPLAAERGVAVVINRPFAEGALFRTVRGRALPDWAAEIDCQSWGQLFLKYILSHPAVTVVIPATSDPRHLEDNMGAGRGRLASAEERARIVRAVAG